MPLSHASGQHVAYVAALEMHHEVLWLIDRWAGQLDPQTVAACRRRHFTAIALEEMRSRTTLQPGIVRLLTQGSLSSQLVRPFAFFFHLTRRNLRPPDLATIEQQVQRVGSIQKTSPMPLVSIIMNVRNGAAFLREALDSVMAQTFADWELIVWDDCSTDDSANIVSQYHDDGFDISYRPTKRLWAQLGIEQFARPAANGWPSSIRTMSGCRTSLSKQMALVDDGVGNHLWANCASSIPGAATLRDYDYFHEFEALPEGDIFAELFRHACFIAMSSAVLRRSAVERDRRGSRYDSGRSRLLPLCCHRAPLPRPRRAGRGLSLSHAPRQHVVFAAPSAAAA